MSVTLFAAAGMNNCVQVYGDGYKCKDNCVNFGMYDIERT